MKLLARDRCEFFIYPPLQAAMVLIAMLGSLALNSGAIFANMVMKLVFDLNTLL